jgi:adenine/guanine phosphoribosyltransferase-like PRPP-binding protein
MSDMETVLSHQATNHTRKQVADTLTQELRNYFNLLESRSEINGYPKINVLSAHWSKGTTTGHRVLIVTDLSPRAKAIQAAIALLPERHSHILHIKYAVDRHRDGSPVTNRQRADYLDVSLNAFNSRLKVARRNLLKKLPDIWPK